MEELKELALKEPHWKPKDDGTVQDECKKEKTGTRTLIPNLIHLVKENGRIKYLVKDGGDLKILEYHKNGGTFYRPGIVKYIVDWDGNKEMEFRVKITGKVTVDPESLGIIKDALWDVVNDDGTGWRARVSGFDVCGKTGTAQVVSGEQIEEYEENEEEIPYDLRPHAWFIGFAPKDNPEIAICVLVEHGEGGGKAAAPIAGALFKTYYDKKNEAKTFEIASTLN